MCSVLPQPRADLQLGKGLLAAPSTARPELQDVSEYGATDAGLTCMSVYVNRDTAMQSDQSLKFFHSVKNKAWLSG